MKKRIDVLLLVGLCVLLSFVAGLVSGWVFAEVSESKQGDSEQIEQAKPRAEDGADAEDTVSLPVDGRGRVRLGVGTFVSEDGTVIKTEREANGWYKVLIIEGTVPGNTTQGQLDADGIRHGYWKRWPIAGVEKIEWWYWHGEHVSQAEFLRRNGDGAFAGAASEEMYLIDR